VFNAQRACSQMLVIKNAQNVWMIIVMLAPLLALENAQNVRLVLPSRLMVLAVLVRIRIVVLVVQSELANVLLAIPEPSLPLASVLPVLILTAQLALKLAQENAKLAKLATQKLLLTFAKLVLTPDVSLVIVMLRINATLVELTSI